MMPLDLSEEDVTCVALNISGVAVELGAEALELENWLILFGCASKELRAVIADLTDWIANSSPHWALYISLMSCRIVANEKRPGVHLLGVGETLPRSLAKLVLRAADNQEKVACKNLKLCGGLEAGIEGTTHAMRRRHDLRGVERGDRGRGETGRSMEQRKVGRETGVTTGGARPCAHSLSMARLGWRRQVMRDGTWRWGRMGTSRERITE